MLKKCKVCKKTFNAVTSLNVYCSYECSKKNTLKKQKTKSREKTKVRLTREKAWATEVKERADWKCEYCGTTENLNAHHIFSRNKRSVKFDIENGICICAKHHVFSSDFSAHKTPTEFTIWVIEYRGMEWYERLRKKAYTLLQDLEDPSLEEEE